MNNDFRENFLRCMAELLNAPQLGFGNPPTKKVYVNRGEGYCWYFLSDENKPVPIEYPAVTGRLVNFRVYQRREGYKGSEPSKKVEVDLDCGQTTYSIVLGFDTTAGRSLINCLYFAKLQLGDVISLAVKAGNDEGGKVVLVDLYARGVQVFPRRDEEIDSMTAAQEVAKSLGVKIELDASHDHEPARNSSPGKPATKPIKKNFDQFYDDEEAEPEDMEPIDSDTRGLDELRAEIRRLMKSFDVSLVDANSLSNKLYKKPVKDLNLVETRNYVRRFVDSLEKPDIPF